MFARYVMMAAQYRRLNSALLHITANVFNPDIDAMLRALGWRPGARAAIEIANCDVGALVIPSGIRECQLSVSSDARIVGAINGGNALTVNCPTVLQNRGVIIGGGGQGGRGGNVSASSKKHPSGDYYYLLPASAAAYGGDGGHGAGMGADGVVRGRTSGSLGGNRTMSGQGIYSDVNLVGGDGGDGGVLGVSGVRGSDGSISGSSGTYHLSSYSVGTGKYGQSAGDRIKLMPGGSVTEI